MNYNYKSGLDINKEAVKPFKQYLWAEFGMKPKYNYNGKRIYITCYGYSLEEKVKNKKMLHTAIHDFLYHYFELVK